MQNDLVLFGIQGSGKGTQARRLVDEFGFYLFEAGGELRKMAATDSELGQTVKSYIDNGHLVPHDIIMQVVSEAITAQPNDQRILFDGVPRDLDQMADFDVIMEQAGREFCCIHILLDEEEAVERIRGRAEQEGRADDANEDKVRRRMDLFREKTKPVIDQYRQRGALIDIDGEGEIGEVYERIREVVKE